MLLGLMVIIALTSFRTLVPAAQNEANMAFNGASAGIMGNVAKTAINGPWPFEDPPHP